MKVSFSSTLCSSSSFNVQTEMVEWLEEASGWMS